MLVNVVAIALMLLQMGQSEDLNKEELTVKLAIDKAQLNLTRTEDALAKAKRDFEEMQKLAQQDVITGDELAIAEERYNNAIANRDKAKLELEETVLGFIRKANRVTIDQAEKVQSEGGVRKVNLLLRNVSDPGLAKLVAQEIPKYTVESLLRIENLYVSLGKNGIFIGQPFEKKITSLDYNQSTNVWFTLAQNADDITIVLRYPDGRQDEIPMFLQSSAGGISIETDQVALEGKLGEPTKFFLNIEHFASGDATYALGLINLPDDFAYRFFENENMITQVRFRQGMKSKQLTLEIQVPTDLTADRINKPVSFVVLVAQPERMSNLASLIKFNGTKDEINAQLAQNEIGAEWLQLTPIGNPRLEIVADNFRVETSSSKEIEFNLYLKNTGSVAINDVHIKYEAPIGWQAEFNPSVISLVPVNEEKQVLLRLKPSRTVGTGDYIIKLDAEANYENKPLDVEDKNLTVAIRSGGVNIGLVLLILFLIGGLVLLIRYMIKLTRV